MWIRLIFLFKKNIQYIANVIFYKKNLIINSKYDVYWIFLKNIDTVIYWMTLIFKY
jgi:hypothetical protein